MLGAPLAEDANGVRCRLVLPSAFFSSISGSGLGKQMDVGLLMSGGREDRLPGTGLLSQTIPYSTSSITAEHPLRSHPSFPPPRAEVVQRHQNSPGGSGLGRLPVAGVRGLGCKAGWARV